MKKEITIIRQGHPLYKPIIDENLGKNGIVRFDVRVRKKALERFIRLANNLSERDLPYGALLMLGYVPGHEEVEDYFIFGVNPDIHKKTHHLTEDFKETLDSIVERAESKDKHDGAFLFTPNGRLIHGGVLLSVWAKKVYRAYGYSDYYYLKKGLGIEKEGGARLEAAIIHSMLFFNALFASISARGSKTKDYIIKNCEIYPIN